MGPVARLFGSTGATLEAMNSDDVASVRSGRLLSPPAIRELSETLGVQPTKKLGQNFLHDGGTVRKIVAISGVGPKDVVLEVGPGLGSLTLGLLDSGAHVCAVEIDPLLAKQLPLTAKEYRGEGAQRLRVHRADALSLTGWQECGGDWPRPTRLIANLPYNVAVPILLHCLELFPSLNSALVMVQAEVADRLVARPGTKIYGVPSVKAAWYGLAKRAGAIGRTVFWPAPNVDSALVDLQVQHPPRGTDELRAATFGIADAAFAQRRKMLRSSLRAWTGTTEDTASLLRLAGIDPTLRAEDLAPGDYVKLGESALHLASDGAANLVEALGSGRNTNA